MQSTTLTPCIIPVPGQAQGNWRRDDWRRRPASGDGLNCERGEELREERNIDRAKPNMDLVELLHIAPVVEI
jgi:hypothetical protein